MDFSLKNISLFFISFAGSTGQEVHSSGGCAVLFSFGVTLGDAQGSCSELEIQHGPLACT